MPRYPRYGFPFQYYRPYNYIPHTPVSNSSFSNSPMLEKTSHLNQSNCNVQNESKQFEKSSHNKNNSSDSTVWLDLFGIKLHFDDVLILSLLFFLYKEDVKDEGLFLALVMLLIS